MCKKILTPAASRPAQKLGSVGVPDELFEAFPFSQFGGRHVVLLLDLFRHVADRLLEENASSVLCFLTRRRLTGKSGSGPGRSISVQSWRTGLRNIHHTTTYDYYAQLLRHTQYSRKRRANIATTNKKHSSVELVNYFAKYIYLFHSVDIKIMENKGEVANVRTLIKGIADVKCSAKGFATFVVLETKSFQWQVDHCQ